MSFTEEEKSLTKGSGILRNSIKNILNRHHTIINSSIDTKKERGNIPKYICKYKPICFKEVHFQTLQDEYLKNDVDFDNSTFNYISEILEEHKMFCPDRELLNDPFEALNFCLFGSSSAGDNLLSANGELPYFLMDMLKPYRILSLTDQIDSPLMWGLYANNYNGVCIGLSTEGTFRNIKKVSYIEDEGQEIIWSYDVEKDKKIKESFYKKYHYWENESEYRIVQNQKYIVFQPEEILFVVIGHNVSNKYKKRLIEICEQQNIQVYRTYLNRVDRKIMLKNIDFLPCYDGNPIQSDFKYSDD